MYKRGHAGGSGAQSGAWEINSTKALGPVTSVKFSGVQCFERHAGISLKYKRTCFSLQPPSQRRQHKTCSGTGGMHCTSRNTAPAHISCEAKAVSFEKGLEQERAL